jgi:hypothetical protein
LVERERTLFADDFGDAVEEAVVFGCLAHVWKSKMSVIVKEWLGCDAMSVYAVLRLVGNSYLADGS